MSCSLGQTVQCDYKKNYSVISEIATLKQSVHVYYKVTEIASPLPGV